MGLPFRPHYIRFFYLDICSLDKLRNMGQRKVSYHYSIIVVYSLVLINYFICVTVGERLVRTQDAETESVRTIHGLLSVKNNSRDNQRARRRQERVGVAGGGTGECCSPGIIHWRGTNERITQR